MHFSNYFNSISTSLVSKRLMGTIFESGPVLTVSAAAGSHETGYSVF